MTDRAEPAIRCAGISKRFGAVTALDDFDLEVPTGSVLSLLGPSGCGKTTALRVIAGFEPPDAGRVVITGRTMVGEGVRPVPPEQRSVGMVFQDYALFPHMTVAENVGYGLDRTRRREGTRRALALVGLEDRATTMPHELSGGEQQRVALARAIAPGPEVILLDEPFSNLDASLRVRMRRDVRRILDAAGATTVFVTHDQEEALAMADTVAVMRAGRILQVGSPQDLYRRPLDRWVASFIGEGELLDGTARNEFVETELGRFPNTGNLQGPVVVLIRPEWISVNAKGQANGVVVDHEYYGHDQLISVELHGGRHLNARLPAGPVFAAGQAVALTVEEVLALPTADPPIE